MNLLKKAFTVSGMTFVSRILGLVREVIIAKYFGAGAATDAFNTAFKIPNLLRRIFAEGAFSQAFVPVLAEYKTKHGELETRKLVSHVSALLGLILLVISLLGILLAPWVVDLTASGFTGSRYDLTVQLLRMTFPYIFFISMASLVGSILNTYGKFSIPAFTPTFLNIAFIACGVFLTPFVNPPIMALGIAVILGGIVQLGFQLPFLRKINMLVRPRLSLKDKGVWRIMLLMVPAILAASISQISLLINTNFASLLVEGSVSWMNYADRLMEFPTGMLGVALGTILLPSLSKHHANAAGSQYSDLLDWGLRLCLILALPCAVAVAVISEPLVATLFMRGKFDAHDVEMTQMALSAYSVGLPALILIKVLVPGFYARQDIKTPVRIGITTLCATQILNIVFIFPIVAQHLLGWKVDLQHIPVLSHMWQLQHAGLALSISLAACLNAGLLYWQLRKRGIYQPRAGWLGVLLKICIALLVMVAVLYVALYGMGDWVHKGNGLRITQLSALVLLGIVAYLGALYGLGFRPRQFIHRET